MAASDLATELARIAGLDTDALRSLWLRMTGKPPSRQLSGDLLRRMVMHRVQERCFGALDRKLAAMLYRLADGDGALPARLRIGSVLVREHGGVVHQVMVVRDGFAWNDRVLPSLRLSRRRSPVRSGTGTASSASAKPSWPKLTVLEPINARLIRAASISAAAERPSTLGLLRSGRVDSLGALTSGRRYHEGASTQIERS